MSSPIRGEMWQLGYGIESTYGATGTTCSSIFGVVQSATLPDPANDLKPFWGLNTVSNRNVYITYRGKQSMQMSLGEFMVIQGDVLGLPIGAASVSGSYVHNFSQAITLPSLTVGAEYVDAGGSAALYRRWYGGKMGRATYSAREEGFLMMSCDMLFNGYGYRDFPGTGGSAPAGNLTGATTTGYDATIPVMTLDNPCDEPYLFSYGALTLDGYPFARVKSFRLSVDNGLQPKYYVATRTDSAQRVPYEIREGRRSYSLSVETDIERDNEGMRIYRELMAIGEYSNVYKGFVTTFTMTRKRSGSASMDTITFTMPGDGTAACGGNAQGCLIKSAPHNINSNDALVSVNMDIMVRSASITVADGNSTYPA